jgi:AraC-like DNA-binding protein
MERSASQADKISRSRMLADYEEAFMAASGLPLRFDPVGSPGGAGQDPQNPFCALMAQTEGGCRMCAEVEGRLCGASSEKPVTEICLAGLADTAVPVVVHGRVAGYLRTGQVALEPLKKRDFSRVTRLLFEWGDTTDLSRMEELWFHSKILEPSQYEAFVRLLQVFARHLSLAAEAAGSVAEAGVPESPVVSKARAYIEQRQHEDIGVKDVARVLNMSVFYFCKVFRKATGMTFTDYLARVRVAKARNLLQNPHLRVSEVAFEVGFQSVTHFNRVFRKWVGCSPTLFRERERVLGA